jgi:hypothetical protein
MPLPLLQQPEQLRRETTAISIIAASPAGRPRDVVFCDLPINKDISIHRLGISGVCHCVSAGLGLTIDLTHSRSSQ